MKKILEEVLATIKPTRTQEQAVKKKIQEVMDPIQKALPQCSVILGGSGSKGTWLTNAHDADIFVRFPYEDKDKDISKLLGKALKPLFKIKKLHGSRDYYQTIIDNFTFEIVPIISITKADDAPNITDVSPLHSTWVKKHKKLADQIRITKQFFKAARVYGAESYINGFSGYLCEVLTIHYKGFSPLLKAISKWKAQMIIDIEGHHKGDSVLFALNAAKRTGPLIVIDPVQGSRNAAAAVSSEKFKQLITYTKKFLSKPSVSFFSPPSFDKTINPKKEERHQYTITPLRGKQDVVGCKLLKCYQHILKSLHDHGFSVLHSDWQWESKATFSYILKKETLSTEKILTGPPSTKKMYVSSFKKKHKKTYEDNGVYYAVEKRKYTHAKDLIADLAKDPYILERVKMVNI